MLNEYFLNEKEKEKIKEYFKEFEKCTYEEIENNKELFNKIVSKVPEPFELIKRKLDFDKEYLIIRNFGINLAALVSLTYFLSNGKLFYIPRLNNAFIAIFEMKNTEELSHTLKDGFFHTDYSTHPSTPDYLTLHIIRKDPHYPFYSRNSIVLLNDILNFLKNYNKPLLEYLIKEDIPVKVHNQIIYQKIIDLEFNVIRFHYKLIEEGLKAVNRKKEIKYLEEFNTICTYLMKDFVLNKGDLAIISNKTVLHKRGPATVEFDINRKTFYGRKLYSIRFYKNT